MSSTFVATARQCTPLAVGTCVDPIAPKNLTSPHFLTEDKGCWSSFQDVLDLMQFDGQVQDKSNNTLFWHRRFKPGQHVLHAGQPFEGLYVVFFGTLKTVMTNAEGVSNVLSFPMKGDLLGLDGVYKSKYLADVLALTECDLIKLPEAAMFAHGGGTNDLERVVYWAISREFVLGQSTATALHSVRSDVRVARFLRSQSERFLTMGYSPKRFTLAMTRRDIGEHLNITLETVSRALSVLNRKRIISIHRHEVEILSFEALLRFGCGVVPKKMGSVVRTNQGDACLANRVKPCSDGFARQIVTQH